jgi:hypothetical protein
MMLQIWMGIQIATRQEMSAISKSKNGFIANQPMRTGLQPATIPRKVQEIVLRHIAEDTIPINPTTKQSGCNIQAKTSAIIISPKISGKAFCGGVIRPEAKARSLVLSILASKSRSR